MPKTNAGHQQAWRNRRADRLAGAERKVAALSARLTETEAELAAARQEIERLSASQCRHPAAVVDGGTCQACGTDVW
jgi:chromosome segregation ATPase